MRKNILKTITLGLAIFAGSTVQAQKITITWAGGGTYAGDGRTGRVADVSSPYDVCIDAQHNIYYSDLLGGKVRKVDAATGIVSTIAGGGVSSGDGIPATSASIFPSYMCRDAAGNIYITCGNTIRKINTSGILTTVAGGSTAAFSGDGGPAALARLSDPSDICTDAAGNLYIADKGNDRIRKITVATGIISTIAGTGTSGYAGEGGPALAAALSSPIAITTNSSGDVFFSDQNGARIRKIDAATGIISLYAGNGLIVSGSDGAAAISVGIGHIWGMCCDVNDNIYINDESCSCRKVEATTGRIYRMAGDLSMEGYNGDGRDALSTWFFEPYGMCVDETGSLYIADNFNARIRKVIQLTNTPSFTYGRGYSMNACQGYATSVDTLLSAVDVDVAQNETWTVMSAPAHGTLSGFPYNTASMGVSRLTMPSGLVYTGAVGYSGMDSFKVKVSDGVLSSVITIYMSVAASADAGSIVCVSHICPGATAEVSATTPGGAWSFVNPNAAITSGMITGVTSGQDTLVYLIPVAGACPRVSYAVMTIDPLPDATISGPAHVCLGSAITLTGATPGGTWNASNSNATVAGGAVTGAAVGTTIIYYAVTTICGTANASYTVNINTAPDAGTISGAANVNEGASTTLTNTFGGGVWNSSDAAIATISAGGDVYGVAAGTSNITYTRTNECGAANAHFTITVLKAATGISGIAGVNSITTAPNPARKNFTINISATASEPVTVVATDLTGKVVSTFTGSTNEPIAAELNVPAGIYLLNINTTHGKTVQRMVIE